MIGVELDPSRAVVARKRFRDEPRVEIIVADYLTQDLGRKFSYVIGNPPYVSLEHISEAERLEYRSRYTAAFNRFDLYMLFFERGLADLEHDGRLAFVTPEKFTYVESAGPLRRLMTVHQIERIEMIPEDAFPEHITYPAVTVIANSPKTSPTAVTLRDGTQRSVDLPDCAASWQPVLMGHHAAQDGTVPLIDYCVRISAGIATGADPLFVRRSNDVGGALRPFAHPALAGRDLSLSSDRLPSPNKVLLLPYSADGKLLPEGKLGALGAFLRMPDNQVKLRGRICSKSKAWYAFHDNCPLPDIRRPKILCKDIGERPKFWIDRSGAILPLHSVYYIVPNDPADVEPLCAWLNGPEAVTWLMNHCQRAANGFIRLQSRVIRNLPVPADLSSLRTRRVA